MMEGSSFDRDIKPCEPGTEIGQQCLRSRNFVKVPGSKIKNNQTSNRSCIGLSQGCNKLLVHKKKRGCNTVGAQTSVIGSINHIRTLHCDCNMIFIPVCTQITSVGVTSLLCISHLDVFIGNLTDRRMMVHTLFRSS